MRKLLLLIAGFIASAAAGVRAQAIQNGLIGYWSGNGNAGDSSPTQNDGTFSGNYVPGIAGAERSISPRASSRYPTCRRTR